MKSLVTLITACALLIGIAVAQQNPAQGQSYPPPQQTQPYPSEQYPPAQQYPSQTQQYPQAQQYPSGSYYGSNVIPAGTELQIRTNENIVADGQSAGRAYSAEIARDVMDPNGRMLIPKNSPARLTVQEVNSGTMGVGSNQVALALQSVSVNGRVYNVISNTNTEAGDDRGIGANKRTAQMTGGGALLGTVIGAIAGGGKGALIGAVVGGAGGAAAQVLTRGKEVKVPAESMLTFRLDQPLTLQ